MVQETLGMTSVNFKYELIPKYLVFTEVVFKVN